MADDFEFEQSEFYISTQQSYTYVRKIYLKSTSRMFEYSLKAIVAAYHLSDDVYSASSFHDSWPGHAPFRGRLDDYFNLGCGWSAGVGDAWLQISLPTAAAAYNVEGIVIKKRCDITQYATKITIKRSDDGQHWQDVLVNVDLVYEHDTAVVLFTTSFDSLCWRVYVVSFVNHASMKFDVIGG